LCSKIKLYVHFFQINLETALPREVCVVCADEIDKIHQYLDTGTYELEQFYLSLRSKCDIKDENDIIDNKENESKNSTIENLKTDTVSINENDNNDESSFDESLYINENNYKRKPSDEEYKMVTLDNHNVNIIKFKCLTCFAVLETQNSLLNHYNMEHNKKSKVKLEEDNYKIVTSSDGSVIFHCDICKKEYNSKKSIIRHIALGHMNERPFLCKLCGK
jgi:uncharacterized C2H2 Zn-finger protein